MTQLLRFFFRITLLPAARLLYRQRIMHADRIPETGGVLLISNHMTYIDALMIYGACPRPVRFVIVSRFMDVRAINWYLKLFGAIAIQPGRPRDAIRKTAEALANGDVVCIFPEGQLTRTGTLLELKKGFELIAKKGDAPVLPMFMDGLWDSIFSHEGGRHFWKWPRRFPCPVRIIFGEPVPAEDATLEWARSRLLALSAEGFAARGELTWSLGEAAVRALKKRPGAACFVEHGKRRRRLKRGQVLAIAIALAERWKVFLPEDESRIGVLLPPGWTPSLINLALVFAGKVPLNLPFDAESFDSEQLAGQLNDLGINTVVTSKAFAPKLANFPWHETEGQFIDMGGELNAASMLRLLMERLLAQLEPQWMAVRRLGLRETRRADGEPACGYLSRPATEPVLLPDASVIANAIQLTAGDFVHRHERIFCEAPLTSAAGTAFALWVPVLQGITCSSRSFSLQKSRSMVETVVHEDKITLLAGQQSLLDQLEGLKEPWHPELRETVRAIFFFPDAKSDPTLFDRPSDRVESNTGVPVLAGWAPDSLGAVVSLNLPDKTVIIKGGSHFQKAKRDGSAGRLLPGIAAEIGENGELLVRGASFGSGEPVPTGWKARFDEEGFLFLESKKSN